MINVETIVEDDICANNHQGNPRSREAFEKADKEKAINDAVMFLDSCGRYGAIADDYQADRGTDTSTAGVAFCYLKKYNFTICVGQGKTRAGCNADRWALRIHFTDEELKNWKEPKHIIERRERKMKRMAQYNGSSNGTYEREEE